MIIHLHYITFFLHFMGMVRGREEGGHSLAGVQATEERSGLSSKFYIFVLASAPFDFIFNHSRVASLANFHSLQAVGAGSGK